MANTPDVPEKCIENFKYLFQKDILRGKVAFITGGGTGIGFTIAEVFMRHGCNVVIGSRRLGKLQESAATLQKETGGTCLPITLDVRKPETIVKAVEETLSKFGRIDYLVNNAAGNFLCPAANLSFNAFRTVMDIDAIGTFNVSKCVYEKTMKKTGGVIVNITAMLHHRGTILQTHAGSAKAAIEAMSKHMAVEWGLDGIRVMCVAPGPIADTEGMRRLGGGRVTDMWIKGIPIQRMGTREDIASSVLFVVSKGGELLTGSVIYATGGEHLTSSNNYYEISKGKSKL